MGAWLKIIAALAGALEKGAAWLKSNQDQKAGAAAQREATNDQTIKTLGDVGTPISRTERDELWERNKAKFGADGATGG